MASKTIVTKLTRKAGNGKGFQLEGQEGWFNATDKSATYLAKIDVGKDVEVIYTEKGGKRTVSIIKEVSAKEISKEEHKKESGKSSCSVCGKELKNDKYPTCWDCKDKPTGEKEEPPSDTEEPKKYYTKSNYGSPEDVAGKEVGCAANCAAVILTGAGVGEAEEVIQRYRFYFNEILKEIRKKK